MAAVPLFQGAIKLQIESHTFFFIIRIAHQLAVLDILRLSVTGTSWKHNKNPVGLLITHLSKSLSLEESRKPLANGLLSIFSFVIYQFNKKNKK